MRQIDLEISLSFPPPDYCFRIIHLIIRTLEVAPIRSVTSVGDFIDYGIDWWHRWVKTDNRLLTIIESLSTRTRV